MFTGVPADRASEGADFVRRALAGHRFGDVAWVAQTGSTNSDVMALAREGAGEGTVLVADHQRSGRGRLGRSWVAPPGTSLLVSVLLRPPSAVAGVAAMTVGVAMVDAIRQVTGCEPRLKWPNDLVIVGDGDTGDRKLAGVLAEADWPPGTSESGGWRTPPPHQRLAVVVGVGVNVNWPAELPDELVETATALNHLVGRDVDRVELLVAFLRRLDEVYEPVVRDRSSASVLDAWRQRSATLGRRVRVDLGADDVEGTAVDVTDQGHLVVETLAGERRTLAVGDVVHLRALPREASG
jgi:BirA family transcriptional regulator, biotin operon repressor / biotin---[acetyl-CoA-carboxylase] ligase